MTKIEAIFGGVLLLAVVAAASFAMFQSGIPSLGSADSRLVSRDGEANLGIFTGDYGDDMCTCYESGYQDGSEYGNVKADVLYSIDDSIHYKAGYSACRSAVGMQGGTAWTEGWASGEASLRTQRKCAFYLKRLNIR